MEKIQNLTNQEKEQLLHHLGKMYRKGRLQTMMGFYGMVEDQDHSDADIEFASKIRLILCRMDQRYALILFNDFFEIKASDWWKEYYSCAAYHCYKQEAMDMMLKQLYVAS